uniref:Uncharacterized protein n=1 Tax=Oryzias latipes TaxID=8090 RepID=Q9W7D1_ORYLA|nr:uncharacterized protein LOC100144347 precursor [Oryzias latipes]AAD38917.1 unknown [Oryzias latipes]
MMRLLLLSCFLLGSITCYPQQGSGGHFLPYQGQAPSYEKPLMQSGYSGFPGVYSSSMNTAGGSGSPPMWYSASYPEQEPAKPTYQRPAQSSGYGSYSGVDSSYSGSGSQQSGSQGAQSGAPGSQHQVEQESWRSSSDDEEEPEFTPVSEEDQVYASKSRSRYNQKRLLFSQFRYTPTEPRVPQEPVFPYPSKSHQGKVSAKGRR